MAQGVTQSVTEAQVVRLADLVNYQDRRTSAAHYF